MIDLIDNFRQNVLIIDDQPDNLTLIKDLLKDQYKIRVANNGKHGLEIAQSDIPPDLILLDIMMPEMDGYEVCQQLKNEACTCDIPVIFLTAKAEAKDEQFGFDIGAVDYITKPVSPPILLARVKTHLVLKAATDLLRAKNYFLNKEVQQCNEEIMELKTGISVHEIDTEELDMVVSTLSNLLKNHDDGTFDYMQKHEKLLGMVFRNELIQIKIAVENLDFNHAFVVLRNAVTEWNIIMADRKKINSSQ
jgi:response regulator RpfG family c-di-GMP phosphodiesterase